MRTAFSDPENYRKMSEPHSSPAAAQAKLDEFTKLVGDARKACGIREVLVVAAGGMKNEDDSEGEFIASFSFGRSSEVPTLAAFALGEAKAHEEQRLASLLKSGRK